MPTLSSSSLYQLAYIREAALGTTPAAETAQLITRLLRNTGESLGFNLTYTSSDEIRADRGTADSFLSGAEAKGGLNFELSYAEYDALIAGAMQSSWYGAPVDTAAAVVAAGNLVTIPSTDYKAGQVIALRGASAIIGVYRVEKVQADDVYLLRPYSAALQSFDLTATIPTGTYTVHANSSRLVNGVTPQGFSIEKRFTDVAQCLIYRGMMPGQMSLSFAANKAVTGSFDFTGMRSARNAATRMPAAGAASQTYPVINTVTGVGAVQEAGTDLSAKTFVQSMSLQLQNNLRGQAAVGVLGAAGVGSGECQVTGKLEVYLAEGSLYDKFVNSTDTSLSWVVLDSTTPTVANGYSILLPRVRYTNAQIVAGSKNTDVVISLDFTALVDPVTKAELIIDRFGSDSAVA